MDHLPNYCFRLVSLLIIELHGVHFQGRIVLSYLRSLIQDLQPALYHSEYIYLFRHSDLSQSCYHQMVDFLQLILPFGDSEHIMQTNRGDALVRKQHFASIISCDA